MATDTGPLDAGLLDQAHDTASGAENDAFHETHSTTSNMGDRDEADTCRICRGEGTIDEPLFYPCKCSGSIKYVHQECLMEWLSHTQKKHCELCKTSFRFTKLYHPGMPSRIPTAVFLRRAALHVLNMFLTWCRGVLVASVWLILLPWCMRVVWRSLFWVGDGGWAPGSFAGFSDATDRNRTIVSDPDHLEAIRSTLEAAKTNGTAHNLTLSKLLMSSLPPTTQQQVFAANEPLLWTILKRMYLGWHQPAASLTPAMSNGTERNSKTDALGFRSSSLGFRSPSLLSDISWFHWFNSQTANRFLIDVFEGQIITMSVVLAFILIFLIREWVVQQQPVINMVALGGDGAAPQDQVAAQVLDEHVEHMPDEQERNAEHDEDDETNDQVNTGDSSDPDPTTVAGALELGARRPNGFLRRQRELARQLRLRNPDLSPLLKEVLDSDGASDEVELSTFAGMSVEQLNMIGMIFDQSLIDAYAMLVAEEEGSSPTEASLPSTPTILTKQRRESSEQVGENDPESSQRPDMPARDKSFIATHIRRSLEEGSSWSFDNVPVASDDASGKSVPDHWDEEDAEASRNHEPDATHSDNEPGSEGSSGSWQQIADVNMGDDSDQALEGRRPQDKGKGRANDDPPQDDDNAQGNDLSTEDRANTEDSIHEGTMMDAEVEAEASTPESVDRDNTPTPNETNAATDARPPPVGAQEASVLDIIMDWIYGPADPAALPTAEPANDEHVVRDIEDEAPFVPFANNELLEPADVPVIIQDPEVAAAAARAGIDVNDQDAIDDAEDLEGILELIGMQGPLIGLFQNAVFSAVLISATLACAVWLPYLWGKVVILFIGSPIALFIKLPLQIVATVTDLLVDVTLVAAGGFAYWISQFILAIVKLSTKGEPGYLEDTLRRLIVPTQSIVKNAVIRITQALLNSSLSTSPGYFKLSINSHAALRTLQNSTSFAVNQTNTVFGTVLQEAQNESVFKLLWRGLGFVISSVGHVIQQSRSLITWIWTSKSYKITLDMDLGTNEAVTSALDYWTANDRLIAVLAGYTFFALAGAIYLRRGTPFSTSQQGQRIERIISDILQQAGGVLKVILIISIEMLAFPLYCGLLLDLAMLPLFREATIYSRWRFACESPWTAGFVHWFIGTCYMFHFALFVSMCRKIMRKGVLYFIRDPDDPTFHPVRDVLERSVTTQLRKIAFSALVYGALVIVCLGGVVWTLSRVTYGVLPIHWTTEAPSLEFPLDLLFYNFLTPVIIKAYKPGEGLHTVCTWWFKKCANALRLSHFLFNERIESEEGHHINTTWFGWVIGRKGEVNTPQNTKEEGESPNENGSVDTYFVPDGRYVRAPASDQCRVPKGQAVFVDVDKDNVRKDGNTDGGVHNSDLVQMVYIPPWFRVRIACFVITIWIFMGISGVSVTIVPLMFGRYLFSLCLPPTVEMNDIHAFSLGVYTLGSVAYSGYQAYKLAASLNHPDVSPLSQLRSFAATASQFSLRVLRFSYVWASLIFAIPLLCAVLIELYFLMPLHAWMGPSDPHVIHLIQDWTLGFLYSRLAARLLFANRNTRPAQAFNQVIEGGYLHPNARIATRCFVLPVLGLFAIAIAVPASVAWLSTHLVYRGASEAMKSQIWRYSFPAVGLAIVFMFAGRVVARIATRWRLVVRDEVYLIGERLHNFGEKRAPQARLDAGSQTSGAGGVGAQTPPVAMVEGN